MKYRAVKPIKKGHCDGCVFTDEDRLCNRVDWRIYPCINELEHAFIYIKIDPKVPHNIIVL